MKLSGIALLFLSLTNHSSPHLCTSSSQVQPEIIKPSDSLSTARPVEKSLKFCCYHRCVSWRQAVVYWRWDGANFHWAEDSPVQPLLAVHKQEFLVCACVHAKSVHACLFVGTHKRVRGEKQLAFIFHWDTRNKNNNRKKKYSTSSSLRNRKGERGKHCQFSCKNYHSMYKNIMKNLEYP